MDIAHDVDAFVFDAFGVLNVGETPIPGAAARLDMLRAGVCYSGLVQRSKLQPPSSRRENSKSWD